MKSILRGLALTLGALALGGAVSCSDGSSTPSGETSADAEPAADRAIPRIIILISIDTLRADHLGLYGYDRFTSPTIDVLGLEGTVFDQANSASPWTLPSHSTMLTGVYPRTHGASKITAQLSPARETLPHMLAEKGWETAAVVAAPWLAKDTFKVTKDFKQYKYVRTDSDRRAPSKLITDQATEWITEAQKAGAPLFLFIHYFDVHADYTSEAEFEELFVAESFDGIADGTAWQLQLSNLEPEYITLCRENFQPDVCTFGIEETRSKILSSPDFVQPVFEERDFERLRDLYDAGIRQMDTELSRLLAWLRKEGYSDDTLIILTSDHGEGFGEHGFVDHFLSAYQEVLHVPLILHGQGIPAGQRIEAPVSHVDLVPTVLELAGLPQRDDAEGLSLVPLIEGQDDTPYRQRPIYGEAPGGLSWESVAPGQFPVRRALRRDNWKMVHDKKSGRFELYDLSVDPREENDLFDEMPAIASRLADEMRERYDGFGDEADTGSEVELSEEEIEQLRSLGYIP